VKLIKKWLSHLKQKRSERKFRDYLTMYFQPVDTWPRERKWILSFKRKLFERRIQKIMAELPPYDKLAQEKAWRKTKAPSEWITPAILAGLNEAAKYSVKSVQSQLLLINMNAFWIQHGTHSNSYTTAGIGGYGDYGGKNVDLGFDYLPLSWEQLCLVAFHYLELDPRVCAARKLLHDVGIQTWWSGDADVCRVSLDLNISCNEETLLAIRRLAKQDADIVSPELSYEFDRDFDLYLKQGWGAEWEEWRKIGPIIDWPPPKFRRKPCLKF
jgi:hypothetical protein